ncbi:MAG: hypothetical protein ACREQW_21630 [Candidatus Binatia bacterium]
MLDLRTIPLADLQTLIDLCAVMGKRGNRFFEDNFWILTGAAVQTHEILEMSEYETENLIEAVNGLKVVIDNNPDLPSDHPTKIFLSYSLTAALAELEKRARKERIKAVK